MTGICFMLLYKSFITYTVEGEARNYICFWKKPTANWIPFLLRSEVMIDNILQESHEFIFIIWPASAYILASYPTVFSLSIALNTSLNPSLVSWKSQIQNSWGWGELLRGKNQENLILKKERKIHSANKHCQLTLIRQYQAVLPSKIELISQ